MRRRGFTLVELLMVIALIALLLTIMVPGLVTVRRLAARTTCAGQLKTIGAGLHQFFAERGYWPKRTSISFPNEWDDTYHDQLFSRYLADPRVMYCPDNSREMAPPDTAWSKSWAGEQRRFSYAILDGMPGPPANETDPGSPTGTNVWLSKCRQQYRVWQYTGSKWEWGAVQEEFPAVRPIWSSFWQSQNCAFAGDLVMEYGNQEWIVNHGTSTRSDPLGMNVLFFDGHVGWLVPEVPVTDPIAQEKQRLWRRIWKGSGEVYLRWLWTPTDVEPPVAYRR